MTLLEAERAVRKLKKERDDAVEMLHRLMAKIEGASRKANMSSVAVSGQDFPTLSVGDYYKFDVVDGIAKVVGVRELAASEHGWDADRVLELRSKTKRVMIGFHKVGNKYRLLKFSEEVV